MGNGDGGLDCIVGKSIGDPPIDGRPPLGVAGMPNLGGIIIWLAGAGVAGSCICPLPLPFPFVLPLLIDGTTGMKCSLILVVTGAFPPGVAA